MLKSLSIRHFQTVYFVNSGSEANDLAMLMARMYTGRYDVISFRCASHKSAMVCHLEDVPCHLSQIFLSHLTGMPTMVPVLT